MNDPHLERMHRYFDEELSATEMALLQDWLNADPMHRTQFAEAAMLHNQLHGHVASRLALRNAAVTTYDSVPELNASVTASINAPPGMDASGIEASGIEASSQQSSARYFGMRRLLMVSALAATLLIVVFLWRGSAVVEAGQAELQKVIAASMLRVNYTYEIHVESNVTGGARQKRKLPSEHRPQKPPLDGARLIVRGASEFVLERITADGGLFLTGSDGTTSWMVPPSGPVRISRDLQRFNHDVPGHEFSMSLCNLPDALQQLKRAYELHALPTEYADAQNLDATVPTDSATRLLVASKKRGYPGPRRVEITYLESTGEIDQLRFVDMPYGPDRLTVLMTRVDTQPSSDQFFHHSSHHTADRAIESD